METNDNCVKYACLNCESYHKLAEYAITLPCNVALFPQSHIITIEEDAEEEVEYFIKEHSLDVVSRAIQLGIDNDEEIIHDSHASTNVLFVLANQYKEQYESAKALQNPVIEDLKRQCEEYASDWRKEYQTNNRVKKQVECIAELLKSIYND